MKDGKWKMKSEEENEKCIYIYFCIQQLKWFYYAKFVLNSESCKALSSVSGRRSPYRKITPLTL